MPTNRRVENRKLTLAYINAATHAGAEFREGARVASIAVESARATGIRLDDGTLESGDIVINAAGAWAGQVRGLEDDRIHFYPVRGQILCFDARPGLIGPSLFSGAGIIVPRRDGRIIAGSIFEDAGFNKSVTLDGMERILHAARALVPSLASIPFREAWAGFRPATDDLLPVLGPSPTVANVLYAAGHFRSGILLSALTGEVIADLVKGRKIPDRSRAVLPRAFSRRHRETRQARRHDLIDQNAMSNKVALGLIRDLFFRSKIDAVASALGATVAYASSLDVATLRCAEISPDLVFADLSDATFPALETIQNPRRRPRSSGSRLRLAHRSETAQRRPREAGFELTLSRSEFTSRLPDLLKS